MARHGLRKLSPQCRLALRSITLCGVHHVLDHRAGQTLTSQRRRLPAVHPHHNRCQMRTPDRGRHQAHLKCSAPRRTLNKRQQQFAIQAQSPTQSKTERTSKTKDRASKCPSHHPHAQKSCDRANRNGRSSQNSKTCRLQPVAGPMRRPRNMQTRNAAPPARQPAAQASPGQAKAATGPKPRHPDATREDDSQNRRSPPRRSPVQSPPRHAPWRASVFQWNSNAARGLASNSAPFRLCVFV